MSQRNRPCSKRIIELQSGQCSSLGFRKTLPSGNRARRALHEVSVGRTSVSQSIGWIPINCLLKIGKATLQVWHIALVPVITATHVKLVSFEVLRVTLSKQFPLLFCHSDLQLGSDLGCDIFLHADNVTQHAVVLLAPDVRTVGCVD